MKLAFVIRLGIDSRPTEHLFEGWVEEVDSCTEQRFHSTAELLSFMGQCFDKVVPANPASADGTKKSPVRKKGDCREKNELHGLDRH